MIYNNVLEAMGHTPIIQLNRMAGPDSGEVRGTERGRLRQDKDGRQHDPQGGRRRYFNRGLYHRRTNQRQSGNRACPCRGSEGV